VRHRSTRRSLAGTYTRCGWHTKPRQLGRLASSRDAIGISVLQTGPPKRFVPLQALVQEQATVFLRALLAQVDGSGVVGKYPVLRRGGGYRDDKQDRRCRMNIGVPPSMVSEGREVSDDEFVYQSRSGEEDDSDFGGHLRFVPCRAAPRGPHIPPCGLAMNLQARLCVSGYMNSTSYD